MSTFGRFEILQELGRGGMGVVFRAHDPVMARDVALKVLRLEAGLDPAQRQEVERRFEREAQAAGALNHPNIVASYERGEIGGHKFIVMEFVEGTALHKVMAEGPRPSLQTSLNILRQIAAGIDYAHSRGVIHRDIKPGNILLPNTGGGVKIADFGIAKSTFGASMTMSSTILGSPHYMSPEQIEGRPVTGRADQWSLAVTAYELIAGQKPFDSDSIAALFQQILATQPRDPSELDARIPSAARSVFHRAKQISGDPLRNLHCVCGSPSPRGGGYGIRENFHNQLRATEGAVPLGVVGCGRLRNGFARLHVARPEAAEPSRGFGKRTATSEIRYGYIASAG